VLGVKNTLLHIRVSAFGIKKMKTNKEKESAQCLLCASDQTEFFFKDKFRAYRHCQICSIIFVPESFHVTRESEKARYEEHNNDPDDIRYRQFLERIAVPIRDHYESGSKGLDFGCGSTTLLADILIEDGFEMEVFDAFYEKDKSVLDEKYDFIVSTEVVEHLNNPLTEFKKLLGMLNGEGILAVMTSLFDETIDFKTWHYKNDRTHIGFYSIETFDWLVGKLGLNYRQIEKDIFLFRASTQELGERVF
jgi:hypothetical protein